MKFKWLITLCLCVLPQVFAQNQPDALVETRALIAEGKAAASIRCLKTRRPGAEPNEK